MPSSNKEYWEKREAELSAIVKGTRTRKPSRKRQADDDSNEERAEVNLRQKTMNDDSSTAGKEKGATINVEVVDVMETPLAQSQDFTIKESNVVSLFANTSNNTPTSPDISNLTQSQVSIIAELHDAVPTPLLPSKPSKVNKLDVSLKSTITTHIGSTSVPARSHSASFKAFIDLPNDDPHCTRVDVKNGSWFHCSLCDTNVKGRSDRPFTIGRWKEHIQSSAHTTRLKSVDYLAQLREKQEKGKVRIYMKHAFLFSSILKTGC